MTKELITHLGEEGHHKQINGGQLRGGSNWGIMAPAQIYIFTLYPGPKFTQPTFTQNPHLHNTKFTRDPNLYEPKFTQPQIYITQFYTNPNIHSHKITPNPNLHRSKFTQVPILHNQGTRYFPSPFFCCPDFLPGQNCRFFRHLSSLGLPLGR